MCNENNCAHEVNEPADALIDDAIDPELLSGLRIALGEDSNESVQIANEVLDTLVQIPDEIECTCDRDEMDNDYEHYDLCPFVLAYPAQPLRHISQFKDKHNNAMAHQAEQINTFRSFISRATR